METSLVVLLFVPILLANTLTASILRNGANPGEVACDPAANPSDCPSNRRCEDMDGDGQSTCVCDSRFYKTNAAGNCVLGLKELIYEMEKEIETLKANVSDNANDIASNEAQISMNAANITAADDQVNMEAMDEMKDKLDALNQSLSGDLDQAMMDLEELELKQQEDINWLNDTMNELLMLPSAIVCPGDTMNDGSGNCVCPGDTVNDGSDKCNCADANKYPDVNGNCVTCAAPNSDFHSTTGIVEGTCYLFSQVKKSHDDAKSSCESHNGKLFEPKTLSINNGVWDKFKEVYSGNVWTWIGINDKETEGTWVYESDSAPVAIQPVPWTSGEPSNSASAEHCGSFYTSFVRTWNDRRCTDTMEYICEIE